MGNLFVEYLHSLVSYFFGTNSCKEGNKEWMTQRSRVNEHQESCTVLIKFEAFVILLWGKRQRKKRNTDWNMLWIYHKDVEPTSFIFDYLTRRRQFKWTFHQNSTQWSLIISSKVIHRLYLPMLEGFFQKHCTIDWFPGPPFSWLVVGVVLFLQPVQEGEIFYLTASVRVYRYLRRNYTEISILFQFILLKK